MNPFNNKAFSLEYQQILQESRRLVVAAQRQKFLDLYQNEEVMIVVSKTGSGKSTQIPKFVLYDELAGNGKIPVTQTRRLAAISVAE
ncbi:hypothetical protein PFICI_08278 [Pestalotiopsis fici W106-1]|uniref:RNA helicase n=1 Tax=Pestalotiopsis fici (strain W106-1 / CGMCC3.15140) TaxID=1229662 RepID=W3X433_PESFW|nr:uncharacterized protein PFICI_08278 [Pestalotiopsis fici W106-1]ETS80749.1 hypothetical protein PFICI_08278 [Pestalotiopsis fici W106-1]